MTPEELKTRTKTFALRVIRLVSSLPHNMQANIIGRQLLRSATSVGANYRASCRSRSDKDFLARMGIVEEEADETMYWMDLLVGSNLVKQENITDLMQEAEEILKNYGCLDTNNKGPDIAEQKSEIRNQKSAIRNPKSEIILWLKK